MLLCTSEMHCYRGHTVRSVVLQPAQKWILSTQTNDSRLGVSESGDNTHLPSGLPAATRLLAKQGHPCGKHTQFWPSLEMLFSLIQISHGRIRVPTERWHGEETPHWHLTGQNIPAEREDTARTSGVESTSRTFRESEMQHFQHSEALQKARSTLDKLSPKPQRKSRQAQVHFQLGSGCPNTCPLTLKLMHK